MKVVGAHPGDKSFQGKVADSLVRKLPVTSRLLARLPKQAQTLFALSSTRSHSYPYIVV